jgi:phage gp16-like protein
MHQLLGVAKTWACKNLSGWDDQMHRDLLQRHGGSEIDGRISAKSMSQRQLTQALKDYETRGFPRTQKVKQGGRSMASYPEARKVRAIWLMLHALGQVRDPSEAALSNYVKRISKVDALQWSQRPDILIESLKSWSMRHLPQHVDVRMRTLDMQSIEPSKQIEINRLWSNVSYARAKGMALFDYYWGLWEVLDGH